ncbi:7-deoxyloganetin glucosyltransferase-like [Prosopis cineraria]|uniref:7-deoxyloganetin glucosyltransferase-like n=1 Tax=Prosopis cineraria TaxID=364024 RepID=UPI00240FE726|nr:7-deoxyloganetin glucosyltransferase-like [Prosopis cineraria]
MGEAKSAKPHVVCVPLPLQGHINPMLSLAKLLHLHGCHVTFVLTHFNFNLLLNSRGPDTVKGVPGFQFEAISDGLPPENKRSILDLPALCRSMPVQGLRSFRELIDKLQHQQCGSPDVPPVSSIVCDGVVGFAMKAAEEFGIPEFVLFTPSGCGMLGYLNFDELHKRGFFPLKDEKNLHDGYLDTEIDWIPAMRGIRLREIPTFFRTTDPSDTMFNYNRDSVANAVKANGVILNTFQALESDTLDAIRSTYPHLYPIGPLPLLLRNHDDNDSTIDLNLWNSESKCLQWLDSREKQSVVYVNFGSLVTMNTNQLREFAWGFANSNYSFLWVIRPNLVEGSKEVLSEEELKKKAEGRFMIVGWCPQEKVLGHGSVGGFLSHCGWNSMLESISEGVPLVCWPFFAEQQMNCFYACKRWGIGLEMEEGVVKREKVERLVRELMEGERGKKMREKALEWKLRAQAATLPGGSSYNSFITLVEKFKKGVVKPL